MARVENIVKPVKSFTRRTSDTSNFQTISPLCLIVIPIRLNKPRKCLHLQTLSISQTENARDIEQINIYTEQTPFVSSLCPFNAHICIRRPIITHFPLSPFFHSTIIPRRSTALYVSYLCPYISLFLNVMMNLCISHRLIWWTIMMMSLSI